MTKTEKVHKPLKWISENCVFPDSAGKELARKPVGPHLLPFQTKIIRQILDRDGNVKSNCFIWGCRKVSKSFLWSMICWYLLNSKKRRGIRLPIMASVLHQSLLIYNQLICQPHKKGTVKFLKEKIRNKETKGELQFFANSPGAALGQESDGLISDEVGAYKSDSTLLNLSTGGALSPDRFVKLFSSNPPLTDDHFSLDLLKNCKLDPEFKVHRFSLDSKADWTVEKNWAIPNPFIREYFDSGGRRFEYVMRFYRSYFNRAANSKAEENAFRRYLLGQFCGAETEFVPLDKLRICDDTVFSRPGLRISVGIDYSVTHDMTSAVVFGWDRPGNKIFVKPFLYLPNTTKRSDSQKVLFEQWQRAGFLKIQGRDVLDGDEVACDVISYLNKHSIKPEAIIFDKALSGHHIEPFFKV